MSGNASSLGGPDASIVLANLSTSLIGGTFNSFFFALATIQAVYYWQHYWENDRPYLKCMMRRFALRIFYIYVTLVTVLSAFHIVFYTYTLWSFLIPSHAGASGSSVTSLPWTAYAQFIANAMGIFAVHAFYLNRLWTLWQNRVFVTVLGILILEVFVLAMYTTIYAIANPTANIIARVVHVETALCTSLAVADVTTTTSLVTLLLRSRNSSGMASQRLVKRLIFYTLTTGTLTALCAVFALMANLKFPEMIVSTTFYDLGASLYTCSFLSSLNARQSLRGKLMATDNGLTAGGATVLHFPRFATAPFTSGALGGLTTADSVAHSHTQVRIEQDTTVHADRAQSIGERPRRIWSQVSKAAPPEERHGSECLHSPSAKEFDARSSDPALVV